MTVGILLIALFATGNLVLGFLVATLLGYGPIWAERMLPKRLRGDASLPQQESAEAPSH